MAIVILRGLITSTLLNLFVLPGLALRFGKFRLATQNAGWPAPFWGLLSGAGGL